MKLVPILLLLTVAATLHARTLDVGSGGTYANLTAASRAAEPGDTILFRGGVYSGGDYIVGLSGRADAWITIMPAPGASVTLRGGGVSWQLADAAYVRIVGFTIEGQTGNGMNLDDAGTLETPAHHIAIERCTFNALGSGNGTQQLKLAGVDSFSVRNCTFNDGPSGGCMVDMVGCHAGLFIDNTFERGGAVGIQAKGGSAFIRIERNRFLDAGARGINVGGNTGTPYFRPQGIDYEASNIGVYSNVFTGGDAAVAFATSVNCEVVNNTIWLPRRWAFRILQETSDARFVRCGEHIFRNNIVVIDATAMTPLINIGANTRPETFIVANNLWFNKDNPGWSGPNAPAPGTGSIVGRDPLLVAPPTDMTPRPGSPAIGAGMAVPNPILDFLARPFGSPRSIGAVEVAPTTSAPAPTRAAPALLDLN